MHLLMLVSALAVAVGLRLLPVISDGSHEERWQRSLLHFLFPPLLLLMTAVALLCMGPQGQMVRWWEGWFSYTVAISFLVLTSALGGKLAVAGWRSLKQIRSYPTQIVQGQTSRLLPTTIPFSAQVGFWHSELVVSQGLLDLFDESHLNAVLAHEQAHAHYRDTFWFFWLGWLRRVTPWLPQTNTLWQELLMLRELRADRWAAERVDTLLLAESLVQMVSVPNLYTELSAAFSQSMSATRLDERIESLLAPAPSSTPQRFLLMPWVWLLLVGLPLVAIPFHY